MRIPERCDALVNNQSIREVFGSLVIQPIATQTASERPRSRKVLAAANAKRRWATAYLTLVSVWLTVSMSAKRFAPSGRK